MAEVCVFEAKLALMSAAGRVAFARDARDDVAVALWRRRADEAREWLRAACEEKEVERVAAA